MKLKSQMYQKDLPNHDQNKLYVLLKDVVPKNVLSRKNKAHAWAPGYNEKYDIWSIGIIAFMLLTGHTPYNAPNKE